LRILEVSRELEYHHLKCLKELKLNFIPIKNSIQNESVEVLNITNSHLSLHDPKSPVLIDLPKLHTIIAGDYDDKNSSPVYIQENQIIDLIQTTYPQKNLKLFVDEYLNLIMDHGDQDLWLWKRNHF